MNRRRSAFAAGLTGSSPSRSPTSGSDLPVLDRPLADLGSASEPGLCLGEPLRSDVDIGIRDAGDDRREALTGQKHVGARGEHLVLLSGEDERDDGDDQRRLDDDPLAPIEDRDVVAEAGLAIMWLGGRHPFSVSSAGSDP